MEPPLSANGATRHSLPARLGHELRTPLNQIIGYTEMLIEQSQEQGQEAFVPDLQRAHTAGRQMLAVINEHFNSIRASDAPATSTPPIARNLAAEESPAHSTAGLGSLLVVDDIESNRDVLSRRLERQGYTVSTADNGREALEKLRAGAFDLVLLDIMMPEMDGYEVLERLKADETLRHLPVIMISALSELESVVRCIEIGAEDYLTKPFNPTLLRARIGACLEKKRAHDREKQLFIQLQENHKRLLELEKLRDDLMHMIIHDLRSPLNGMVLSVEALEEMGDLNEAQREMLEIAQSGGKTLTGMINDLLDISKMESGSMLLEFQEITALELVGAAIKQVAPLAAARKLTLATKLDPALPGLHADKSKLLRTLVNLLGNAIKFTPPAGNVTVAAGQSDDRSMLRFSVSDTGEGIPSEAFGRIFEKFRQVESRQGGRMDSSGLGLTFCKLAVEAHGGHIAVESSPGCGSTFSFTIPFASPASRALASLA